MRCWHSSSPSKNPTRPVAADRVSLTELSFLAMLFVARCLREWSAGSGISHAKCCIAPQASAGAVRRVLINGMLRASASVSALPSYLSFIILCTNSGGYGGEWCARTSALDRDPGGIRAPRARDDLAESDAAPIVAPRRFNYHGRSVRRRRSVGGKTSTTRSSMPRGQQRRELAAQYHRYAHTLSPTIANLSSPNAILAFEWLRRPGRVPRRVTGGPRHRPRRSSQN
jgi:hypothetical protein